MKIRAAIADRLVSLNDKADKSITTTKTFLFALLAFYAGLLVGSAALGWAILLIGLFVRNVLGLVGDYIAHRRFMRELAQMSDDLKEARRRYDITGDWRAYMKELSR